MIREAAFCLLVLALVFFLSASAQRLPAEDDVEDAVPNATSKTTPLPECVVDLDCGTGGATNYTCWEDFIVIDYVSYKCVGAGGYNASCERRMQRTYVDWCRPTEVCVPGESSCQPADTHGEVKVKAEKVISECEIECVNDTNCGLDWWGSRYCGGDGSVYQDYITFRCHNPGGCNSFCRHKIELIRRADHCGPYNPCVDGACFEEEDWGWELPDYECEECDPCLTEGKVYYTCQGQWCFDVKTLYSEVDVVPGHIDWA